MKNMSKVIFSLCIFFSLFTIAFAEKTKQDLPINIEGDYISYSQNKRFMEASGNVTLTYEDYIISANYMKIDLDNKQAEFSGRFSFVRNKRAIRGLELSYDLDLKEGVAKDVLIEMDNLFIFGKLLSIYKDKVVLNNSAITTCSIDDPHYKITATNTKLYLNQGIVVSSSGLFWIADVPVMIVPNYVLGGANVYSPAPLPRIGSDKNNGSYIKEDVNIYADEKKSGSIDLEWAEKQGISFGFRHDWRDSPVYFGNFRARYHPKEGLEGGISSHFLLTDQNEAEQRTSIIEQFFNFVPFSSKPILEAQFDITSGEIYQDDRDQQRVSFLPQLALKVPQKPSLIPGIDHVILLKIGNILEENQEDKEESINRIRLLFGVDYIWANHIFWDIDIKIKTAYQGKWYWNKSNLTNSWNVINGNLTFLKDISILESEWSYYHNFINEGSSAFLFDSKESVIEDEIKYQIGLNFGQYKVSGKWRYNLENEYYRDIDFSIQMNMHCWNLILTKRETRKEINIGISLQ
jgi:hypothetical protein